jgi:hypothetical protein
MGKSPAEALPGGCTFVDVPSFTPAQLVVLLTKLCCYVECALLLLSKAGSASQLPKLSSAAIIAQAVQVVVSRRRAVVHRGAQELIWMQACAQITYELSDMNTRTCTCTCTHTHTLSTVHTELRRQGIMSSGWNLFTVPGHPEQVDADGVAKALRLRVSVCVCACVCVKLETSAYI